MISPAPAAASPDQRACAGCERLPAPIPEQGWLYLWAPLGHTAGKVRTALKDSGLESTMADEAIKARVTDREWPALAETLRKNLAIAELEDTKCLLLDHDRTPGLADIAAMSVLSTLLSRVQGRWLYELLMTRKLATHFQPIVNTTDPSDVFAYECLVRGVNDDGSLVPPGKLYEMARAGRLLFHLDRAARLQHIRSVIQQKLDTHIFINFNPTAIYDPQFCLKTTVAAIKNSDIPPERFVFEVVESDEIADMDHLPRILDYYRDAGFKVALDDLGAGYGSLNLLGRLRPDFVKLDMQLVRNVDRDEYKAQIVGKLLEVAHLLGIKTIAEGIETEGEWQWMREHRADFVQGYYFGRPSPVPQPVAVPALVDAP